MAKKTAAEVLKKIASEGKDLSVAVKRSVVKAPTEDATLQALKRNIGRVVSIPVGVLIIEKNVRKILDTDSDEFQILVEDIRRTGVRQNIAAELHEDGKGEYRLTVVFGQRRVLAALKAGIETIPALIVQPGDPAERIFLGLAENIFRTDMHPLDKAEAYQELMDAGWSAQMLSEKFERRKRTVQGFLRLARFPQKAKGIISKNPDHFTTRLLFNRFLGRAWKDEQELVQALQNVIKGNKNKSETKKVSSSEVIQLAQIASRLAGISCKGSGTVQAGKIVFTWRNQEELDKLNALFGENILSE